MITIWHIWEAKNNVKNGDFRVHPQCVVEKIQVYTEMVLSHLYKPVDSKRCDLAKSKQWAPSSEGWVKVNVRCCFICRCRENVNWVSDQKPQW